MSVERQVDLNGRLLPAAEARVPTTNLGLLYGIGLFETMQAHGGHVFRLDAHIRRLTASAEKLGVPVDVERLPTAGAVTRLLQANGLEDARVRLTVSGTSADAEGIHDVLMTAGPATPYPAEYYERGVTVLIGRRIQDPADPLQGHKTTSYWSRLQALHEAQLMGCVESLWLTPERGLAEGCISNLFIVRDGCLVTPPENTPVLPGITRATVLELCAAFGIAAEQRPLTVDDLLDADEAFLTNCMMALIPVVRVERHPIEDERPGPLTRRLAEAYAARIREVCRLPDDHV